MTSCYAVSSLSLTLKIDILQVEAELSYIREGSISKTVGLLAAKERTLHALAGDYKITFEIALL